MSVTCTIILRVSFFQRRQYCNLNFNYFKKTFVIMSKRSYGDEIGNTISTNQNTFNVNCVYMFVYIYICYMKIVQNILTI